MNYYDREELLNKQELRHDRRELVVKHNEIIRTSRYTLSTTEQKIVIYLISQIKASDTELKEVSLSIKEFARLAGIDINGKVYSRIKDQIQTLADKSWWLDLPGEKQVLFRFIDTAMIEKGSGIIKIKLHSSLEPYLIGLRENFTKYELINVLILKSKYSIRLYEILKSYLWQGSWDVDIDTLRKMLEIGDKYTEFKEFRRRVLVPAVNEINKYTDLELDYKTIKKGKEVRIIAFKINETKGYQLTMDLLLNQSKRLDDEW